MAARRTGKQKFPSAAAAVFALLVAATAFLEVPPAHGEEQARDALRVVGQMPRPNDRFRRPMAVDERSSLGFVTAYDNSRLYLFDLARLVEVGSIPQKALNGGDKSRGFTPESGLALDPGRERLYATGNYPTVSAGDGRCEASNGLPVFDYRAGPDGRRSLVEKRMGPMPCTGPVQFNGLTNWYDPPPRDRLYMGGVAFTEAWRVVPSDINPLPSLLGGTSSEDRGQPLLVRQMRIEDGSLVFPMNAGCLPTVGLPCPQGVSKLHLEWEVDLRLAGCGRRHQVNSAQYEGFVARLGDDVFAYCWDARVHRASSVGQQGYLVRIPLVTGEDGIARPATRGNPVIDPTTGQITNYVARRIPTLPGFVNPIFDPVSGRLMLVTTDRTNGNAVWVFDPKTERFVGVITGGYADEEAGQTAVGFDSRRGRVYVATKHGILIAPIRNDPLPAGLLYPVLREEDRRAQKLTATRISVAPALGRLFVAVGTEYQVIEDQVPDPPRVERIDPDSLTTQVNEEGGKTASASSGQAMASGLHVVNTGGGPRVIGQSDPTCVFSPPNTQRPPDSSDPQDPVPDWELAPAVFGSCLADVALTPGHREMAAAAAELAASTSGGTTARAAALSVPGNDTGTDGDVRRASACGADIPDAADRWGRRWPFPDDARMTGGTSSDAVTPVLGGGNKKDPGEKQYNEARDAFWDGFFGNEQAADGHKDYRDACTAMQDDMAKGSAQTPTGPVDLRAGTKGSDGKGFPLPAALCGDFGDQPSAETWPEPSAGMPQAGYPTSHVMCDASAPGGRGTASLGSVAFPTAADPQLTVARTSARVTSVRTANEGQVTIAYASAAGVTIGPLSIAEIRSLAITKARGHAGTTDAYLVRQWCGISVVGPESNQEQPGCVDAGSAEAKAFLDEVSAGLLQKIQLSVPEGFTQETPKGYQSVVTKSPGQRGADQTVNDDDSHTVSALQVVLYNDGPRGRSRLVLQLAGVHAESRYGIIELPNFDFGGFEEPTPSVEPETQPSVDPTSGPESGPSPSPDLFTPEIFVEEGFETDPAEFVRFSAPAPRTVQVPGHRGNPVERIVRVPVRVISDAINLLVQNPREAALLFALWALLATPVYLGLRRRSFAKAMV